MNQDYFEVKFNKVGLIQAKGVYGDIHYTANIYFDKGDIGIYSSIGAITTTLEEYENLEKSSGKRMDMKEFIQHKI